MTTDRAALNDRYPRPARIAPAEWAARVQLAAAYRIFVQLGWQEMIYNHLSLRVPDEPGHFLLNPFGLHYSEVCASNLVKVDVRGNTVGHSDWPINPAGFTFHGAIHEALADAHCVMHMHTTATMAVCCLEDGLSLSNFYAVQLHGQLAHHDFEGITVHPDEGRRILASAGGKKSPVVAQPRAGGHWRQSGPCLRPDVAVAARLRGAAGGAAAGPAAGHHHAGARRLRARFAELQPDLWGRAGRVRRDAAAGRSSRSLVPGLIGG